MVFCTICREMKPGSEFHNNRTRKNGKQTACKDCARGKTKDWRKQKTPSQQRQKRHAALQRNYGLTIGEYEYLVQKQNGVCAACKGMMDGHELVVDHNHETGQVRGLLCRNCNAALGLLKDEVSRVRGLLYYMYRAKRRADHAASRA